MRYHFSEECPYRGSRMSFEGRLPVGSSCALFLNFGTVSGVPGVTGYFDTGHGASVGVLYDPTGNVARTFQRTCSPYPVDGRPISVNGCSGAAAVATATLRGDRAGA